MSRTPLYTAEKALYSGAVSPPKGGCHLYSRVSEKEPLRRAVEALLPTGVLSRRGAQSELARLFGVEPREVWWTVAQIRRRSWMTTLPKAKVRR